MLDMCARLAFSTCLLLVIHGAHLTPEHTVEHLRNRPRDGQQDEHERHDHAHGRRADPQPVAAADGH